MVTENLQPIEWYSANIKILSSWLLAFVGHTDKMNTLLTYFLYNLLSIYLNEILSSK